MNPQSFHNHIRVHPLYHYVAVPVSLALVAAGAINLFFSFGLTAGIVFLLAIVLHLAIFLARDYAKKNQDRIIRAELRMRYYLLTNNALEPIERQLSTSQLLALRFASDKEFVSMVTDPETPSKAPGEIKRQIISWNADLMRV